VVTGPNGGQATTQSSSTYGNGTLTRSGTVTSTPSQ
jgi:hypothetical protein